VFLRLADIDQGDLPRFVLSTRIVKRDFVRIGGRGACCEHEGSKDGRYFENHVEAFWALNISDYEYSRAGDDRFI
jgi:hypothetical protein